MDNTSQRAIQAANNGRLSFCKFLSANDTGDTGGHQAGIYIKKDAVEILFDEPGTKGSNKDRFVKICWHDDFTTESHFIYYGTGTRDEYRITRFGRGFPFLRKEHTGDLFVLVMDDYEDYCAYVLETEEDINTFLGAFAMGPADTGAIIKKDEVHLDGRAENAVSDFVRALTVDFPTTYEMSQTARKIYNDVYNHVENVLQNPDELLVDWIEIEYRLFRKIEFFRYGDMIAKGFTSVEQFIDTANMVLNRRKSRAGKSLEHHLAAIFDGNSVLFQSQPKTEGNKHPDFIFPNEEAYQNFRYPANRLVFLGAKTTCKDRWRQITTEADRIPNKHLLTLQQGISAQQLDEMESQNITLVVPSPYIKAYPREKWSGIWTLRKFIAFAKEKEMGR